MIRYALLFLGIPRILFADPDKGCFHSYSYDSVSRNTYQSQSGGRNQVMRMEAKLLVRRLSQTNKTLFYGLQWYQPKITLDKQAINDPVYLIPMAVSLNARTRAVEKIFLPRTMSQTNQDKLAALFYSLHTRPPQDLLGRLLSRYHMESSDQNGLFMSRYFPGKHHEMVRENSTYHNLLPHHKKSGLSLSNIKVLQSTLTYEKDSCWLKNFKFHAVTKIAAPLDMRIFSTSKVQGHRLSTPVPPDALLAKLTRNPAQWPDFSRLLSPDVPEPLKDEEEFSKALKNISRRDYNTDELTDLIATNGKYLRRMRELLDTGNFSDGFISRLFLAVGKADTLQAQRFLAAVAMSPEESGKNRFRALMGLRYSENLNDRTLTDELLHYGGDMSLSSEDRDTANSLLLVLGSVSGNMSGSESSGYILGKLKEMTGSGVRETIILDAIGNSRLESQSEFVGKYLTSENPKLRIAAAENYVKVKKQGSSGLLWSLLKEESNPAVRAAMIGGLELQSEEDMQRRSMLFTWTEKDKPHEIRLASIRTLSRQLKGTPQLKAKFKRLLPGESNPGIIEALMKGIYQQN